MHAPISSLRLFAAPLLTSLLATPAAAQNDIRDWIEVGYDNVGQVAMKVRGVLRNPAGGASVFYDVQAMKFDRQPHAAIIFSMEAVCSADTMAPTLLRNHERTILYRIGANFVVDRREHLSPPEEFSLGGNQLMALRPAQIACGSVEGGIETAR